MRREAICAGAILLFPFVAFFSQNAAANFSGRVRDPDTDAGETSSQAAPT